MATYKFKLTQTFRLPIQVQFDVEFDTETGESELVGGGVVTSAPEHLRRRQIQRLTDVDDLDIDAYRKLLDDGTIPMPEPGETIHLHGEPHLVDIDPEYLDDDEEITPHEVIESLLPSSNPVVTSRKQRLLKKQIQRRRLIR